MVKLDQRVSPNLWLNFHFLDTNMTRLSNAAALVRENTPKMLEYGLLLLFLHWLSWFDVDKWISWRFYASFRWSKSHFAWRFRWFSLFSQGFQGDNVTQVDWRTLHRSPGVGWLGSQAKIGKLCEPRWWCLMVII